jgi:polyribonucleotide nucleotidyltransferase
MPVHRVELEIGGRTLSIEHGKLAKQCSSVVVQYGDTVVLGTAVHSDPRPGLDFFPLTVDYREKFSAAGKFAGGFRKREGAPNQKEILTMRNIDRPIRPLFPPGYIDEVQIQCWVLAYDGQNEPDVLAGIAAAASLSLSSAPFQGPIGNVRVGRIDGKPVIMPTKAQEAYSDLDLLLCGHEDGLNMIEVGAHEIPEAEMLECIRFGFDYVKQVTALIKELVEKDGQPKESFEQNIPADVQVKVQAFGPELKKAKTSEGSKLDRQQAVKDAKKKFKTEQFPEPDANAGVGVWNDYKATMKAVGVALHDLEEDITREIIRGGSRTDGRNFDELRNIECEVGLLPKVHGSGLFQRGETQALVTAVLGTGKDEQMVDGLDEEYAEKFYLHYNFPPFSVGEAKRITGPGRREIGHGMLAQRALAPVLPDVDKFPYTVRLVSDILESNGSSSMASACGGTLALMDAGVPIKAPVAGISIGIIAPPQGESGEDIYLTDIQGEEDHFGDMDFKVCGTRDGITAIQLDLKTRGLTMDQIEKTFELAKKNRIEIIEMIEQTIPEPRKEIAPSAPRMLVTTINPDKIGKLIGPGGKNIRAIQEASGAKIDIEEDGTVFISAVGAGKAEKALEEVEKCSAEVKVGQIYTGRVTSVKDFGAFIEVIPGQDGLCHVSELSNEFVKNVGDVVKVGDELRVKVILVDDQGRVKLSRKKAIQEEGGGDD